jgi:hypothetical protein
MPVPRAYFRTLSSTCSASSRVGVSTSARVRLGPSSRRLISGSVKAAVLPVPVCARPMMSEPRSASGIASR